MSDPSRWTLSDCLELSRHSARVSPVAPREERFSFPLFSPQRRWKGGAVIHVHHDNTLDLLSITCESPHSTSTSESCLALTEPVCVTTQLWSFLGGNHGNSRPSRELTVLPEEAVSFRDIRISRWEKSTKVLECSHPEKREITEAVAYPKARPKHNLRDSSPPNLLGYFSRYK